MDLQSSNDVFGDTDYPEPAIASSSKAIKSDKELWAVPYFKRRVERKTLPDLIEKPNLRECPTVHEFYAKKIQTWFHSYRFNKIQTSFTTSMDIIKSDLCESIGSLLLTQKKLDMIINYFVWCSKASHNNHDWSVRFSETIEGNVIQLSEGVNVINILEETAAAAVMKHLARLGHVKMEEVFCIDITLRSED